MMQLDGIQTQTADYSTILSHEATEENVIVWEMWGVKVRLNSRIQLLIHPLHWCFELCALLFRRSQGGKLNCCGMGNI